MKRAIGLSVLYAVSWLSGHNAPSYGYLFVGIVTIFTLELIIYVFKSLWGGPSI